MELIMPRVRLEKQLRFMVELDKLKRIVRHTRLTDHSRLENDAEHSWHMAVYASWMAEYATEKMDVLRAVKMCLIHDVVEIDAGDAYAYDAAANVGKAERERKAAERIFHLLPEDQYLEIRSLWEDFEEMKSPEARFAAALDRLQSVLNNYHAGGVIWKEHGIKESQIQSRIGPVRSITPALWEYLQEIVTDGVRRGWIAPG